MQLNLDSEQRRRLLGALGVAATPMVAGCLGDDEGNGGDDGNGDDTPTDTPEDGNGDDTPTDTPTDEGIERHDFTMHIYRGTPVPADAQFNPYAGTAMPSIAVGAGLRHDAVARSNYDQQIYGEMIDEWQYQPGILEFTLNEDFYFWDGDNIDADTWMTEYRFEDYLYGGESLNYDSDIVNAQQIDDYTVRYTLADAWNEDYAIQNTILNHSITASKNFLGPWLEDFEDAGNMDEIESIREEMGETLVHDPNPFYNIPFMITGAEESYWTAQLRTRELLDEEGFDHEEPHFVDQINYENVRWYAVDDFQNRSTQGFRDGNVFYHNQSGDYIEPDGVDFETLTYGVQRGTTILGWLFNCSSPPSSNARFRRAWDYMCNREAFLRPFASEPRTSTSPFLTDSREENFVSADIRENFTDYSWDTAEFDKAEQEMLEGGFERDSDDNWLYQEGDQAGEPMEWEVWVYGWQDYIVDNGGQFVDDMEEFGISLEYRMDNALWMRQRSTDFTVDTSYIGGGIPVLTMGQTFGDDAISGAGNPQPPDTFEAPPVGTPWEEADELETFETRTMADQLAITTDEDRYQRLVDRLAWVANQTVPRAPVYAHTAEYLFNDHKFDYSTPEEAPEQHMKLPYARMYYNGATQFVPEDER